MHLTVQLVHELGIISKRHAFKSNASTDDDKYRHMFQITNGYPLLFAGKCTLPIEKGQKLLGGFGNNFFSIGKEVSLSIEKKLFQQIPASAPPYSSELNGPGFLFDRSPGPSASNGRQFRFVTLRVY
ncbi:hypothetical protein EVAR_31040_1 [Eumeta japonica]|uniref:Uncharacterized protein n=1 Tax=Eumeta variegata TaxID=151549 RepID=A0A4C1VFG6_EUMVA|nr:hypothetical protein EVAR_31040_1 [Eumeta japonica]